MIKNDDLLALPRAAKPAKAMRAAQEHARPAGEPGNGRDGGVRALLCAGRDLREGA